MSAECLIDSNIIFYAAMGRRSEPEKHRVARDILVNEDFAVSTQVLQEFYVNVTRKSDVPLGPIEALKWIDTLLERPCAIVGPAIIKTAIEHSARFQIGYWDAALVATAESIGAGRLLTEDLNHQQRYGSVTVINPFRTS